MKTQFSTHGILSLALGVLLTAITASAATLYVWQNSRSPSPPHTNWATAAHTIQHAVDAAQAGDTVLVTNGLYASGGRAVHGLMTNRLAVDKAATVRSCNGPEVTVIQGRGPVTTFGDEAIRCAYLASGAVLSGFTLTNGATRSSGDNDTERSGGGAYGGILTNCVLAGNTASQQGGGAYGSTLHNCRLTGNAGGYKGGGACVMLAQARAFAAALPVADIIVSHLDEEPRWGKLWNLMLGTGLPIRYLSSGQNIPGEFVGASAERVLSAVFEGS